MIGILLTKFRLTARKPWSLIILTVLCIGFAFFMGGGEYTKVPVPVASTLSKEETGVFLKELNRSDLFMFIESDEAALRNDIKNAKNEAGLLLHETDFTVIASVKSSNVSLLQRFVVEYYNKRLQKDALLNSLPDDKKESAETVWETALKETLFSVNKSSFSSDKARVIDMHLQSLFGFSLFFVIYTVSFSIAVVLEEKRNLIWNRMVVSPVRKWEMYAGNLVYSFLIGYGQIVIIFLTFRYGAGVEFHGGFGKTLIVLIPYVLTIVALCMLLAGLAKSIRQYNAFIPIISVVMAMLGGAYWPIEIVTSDVMIFLSNFSPILYGMEALKGATLYGKSMMELLEPLSILLLMAVVMMGLGINAMENRKR